MVNAKIRENIPLKEYRDLPIEEAKKLGAIALFGEKYGDKVRVVQFGSSVEFCGGCHVKATGQIGMVRIISESSIAAGVRRIEAVTGKAVEDVLDKLQDTMNELRTFFNNAPDLVSTIKKHIEENAELRKAVEDFKAQKAIEFKKQLIDKSVTEHGMKVISAVCPLDSQSVKDIAFQLRAQFTDHLVVAIGSLADEKPGLTVALSDDMVKEGKNAGSIIREAARLIQGGGGGQPHFATAGGKNPDGLQDAVNKIVELAIG